VRAIVRTWSKLRLDWEVGRHRLPFFTQKVAVVLLGVLVATLALVGGVVILLGPPDAGGPDRLVPEDPGRPPSTTRPAAGHRGTDRHHRPGRAATGRGRGQLGRLHPAALTASLR
jgi:hypothetical protein